MEQKDRTPERLSGLLDKLFDEFDYLDRKLRLYEPDDAKYFRLLNSKNRAVNSIILVVSLLRDPRFMIMPEGAKKSKEDIAKLMARIKEEDDRESLNAIKKIQLMTYKDYGGRRIPRTMRRSLSKKDG